MGWRARRIPHGDAGFKVVPWMPELGLSPQLFVPIGRFTDSREGSDRARGRSLGRFCAPRLLVLEIAMLNRWSVNALLKSVILIMSSAIMLMLAFNAWDAYSRYVTASRVS